MKKLLFLSAALPSAALAHGGHAPVPEVAHGMTHIGPGLGLATIVLVAGLAVYRRWFS